MVEFSLSANEQTDVNKITVTIPDQETPIIVLYGPPACGKTMTMVRMARYLKAEGYSVVPERSFRPSADSHYKMLCGNFDNMVNSNNAAQSTSNISFMLLKVLKDGKPICQILEAPGEYYFSPSDPDRAYPPYVLSIIGSKNRKVWAVMLEPDWADAEPRRQYVGRIKNLATKIHRNDKVVFVYNKIDTTPYVRSAGNVNTKEAIKNVMNLYPGIFKPFENTNPITRFWKAYSCEFVPFTTGSYSKTTDGGFTYTESHGAYAQKFWQVILGQIQG